MSPDRPPPAPRPGISRALLLSLFVLIYGAMQVGSLLQKSATYDEPLHLTAGYAALAKGDHRIDPSHPPLTRMWAALPLLAMSGVEFREAARIDRRDPDTSLPRQNTYAHSFIYAQPGVDADRMLNWGRVMIVILGAALGFMIFQWVEAWLGAGAAALALLFYLLSPNLGAHAALVTTDFGVTCFYFGTVYFCWRTCRHFGAVNVAGLTVCFVAALLSKFSAVLLIPTGAVLLAWAVWRGLMTGRRAGLLVLLLGAVTYIAIWAAYDFRYEPSATAGWVLHSRGHPEMADHLPVLTPVLTWIDQHHLLPNAFVQGFLMCFAWSEILPGYLAGATSADGWWYYYPVAFVLKTPLALLVLFGAGVGLICWRRGRVLAGEVVFVIVPLVVYLGAAMTTEINIGLRHILPVYPFVILLAAMAGGEILRAAWSPRRKVLVLGPLVAFWMFSFSLVYPHTLTFFSLAVGGAPRGEAYLADSNLDWGQHLKLLKRWMDRQGVDQINLAYFGIADPAYYGIKATLLPGVRDYLGRQTAMPKLPGYVAISATIKAGVYLRPEWRLFYAGFDQLQPAAVLGNTLKIYWVEQWPEDDSPENDAEMNRHGLLADGLHRLGWHEHALLHYQKLLARYPGDSRAYAHMALMLLDEERTAEGLQSMRRAIELEPANPEYLGLYAIALIQRERFSEAAGPARELVRLQPDQARNRDLLGIALAGDGRFVAAVAEFRRALELAPDNAAIRDHLAHASQYLPPPRL